MTKQIFQITEKTYHLKTIEHSVRDVPFRDIESINQADLCCVDREEFVYNELGKLLEHKMYDDESRLSVLKIFVYYEEEVLLREINYCLIRDVFIDVNVDYSEDSYLDGRKMKRFFRQIDSDSVNEGNIEYSYSDDFSRIIDPSQPNLRYKKLSDQNFTQVVEDWIIDHQKRV